MASITQAKTDLATNLQLITSIGDSLSSTLNDIQGIASVGGNRLNPKDKDPLNYVLDLMSMVFGPSFLENGVDKVMKNVLGKNKNGLGLEKYVKKAVFNSLVAGMRGQQLPADFAALGYTVPVRTMDLFDLFGINPASPVGGLLYNDSSFEKTFFTQVLQGQRGQSTANIKGLRNVKFQYDITGNTVVLSSNVPATTPMTVDTFFAQMLDDTSVSFTPTVPIVSDILDFIFNYAKAKSKRAIENEEKLRQSLDKIMREETEVSTVYAFNPKSLEALDERVTSRRVGGYSLDLGCNVTRTMIDPELIATAIAGTSDYSKVFTDILSQQTSTPDGQNANDATRDNFAKSLIKALVLIYLKHTLLSPRIWTMFMISNIFRLGYPQSPYAQVIATGANQFDLEAVIKDQHSIIQEVTLTMRRVLTEKLTELVMKEIVKRLAPVQASVALESAKSYEGIMGGLTGFVSSAARTASDINSIV